MASSSSSSKKPHAVVVCWPAQGHVNALLRFSKLLYSKGFHITFVHNEFNYNRLLRTYGPDSVKGLPHFRFEKIKDGTAAPTNPDSTQDATLLSDWLRRNGFTHLKALVEKLNAAGDVPSVSCVIGDGITTFTNQVAEHFGVPGVQMFACSGFSFICFLHFSQLQNRAIFPFKNEDFLRDGTLDTRIDDWLTGLGEIRLRDLPSFFRSTDPNEILFHFAKDECEDCLKGRAMVFNNFEVLEQDALQLLETKFNYSSYYSVGPLSLLEKKHVPEDLNRQFNQSLWKQDPKVLDWLQGRQPDSVLYVNYGCFAKMSTRDFQEFAWGIANSKQPFLWIVRPDVVQDGPSELPDEFLEETKDRGCIASWCDQERVLNHPAVGAFLTHCGWNSMTETLSAGKPVICWTFFADQPTNCWAACNKFGIGMEIDPDVKREQVSTMIKEMMTGKKGEEMRKRAGEWKEKAERATDVGGSSYVNLDKLIKEVLLVGN